jgi:hypothetical protein
MRSACLLALLILPGEAFSSARQMLESAARAES